MRKNEAVWVESRQRWQINVQSDGVRKTFTDSTQGRRGKAAAERKADKWMEDHTSTDSIRIDALLDQYEEHLDATKSVSYAGQYKYFVRLYIRPVIGRKKISRLTEGDLQDIIDYAYADRKLADKTLRDIRACVTNFIKWCRKHGRTRLYPEDLVIPAGAKKTERTTIQPQGISTLFSSSKTTWRGKPAEDWYIHAYRFSVLTGLRPGELRGLRFEDIKGDKVSIKRSVNIHNEITQGKNNNARRTFVMSRQAAAVLAAQKQQIRDAHIVSPWVFPAKNGSQMKHDHFYSCWQRYCEANSIPKVSLYEIRHTFVSVNKEMPAGLKKMVVGHSKDMDTEGVYGHEMTGDMEKAARFTEIAFSEILEKK